MTPSKLNLAVADTGLFGREHLCTLSTMKTLVRVADTNQAAVSAAVEQFGISRA